MSRDKYSIWGMVVGVLLAVLIIWSVSKPIVIETLKDPSEEIRTGQLPAHNYGTDMLQGLCIILIFLAFLWIYTEIAIKSEEEENEK